MNRKLSTAILVVVFLVSGYLTVFKGFSPKTTDSKRNTDITAKAPSQKTVAPADNAPVFKGQQLLPVDEASKDQSFKAFRDELITAVDKKDINFLRQHIDKNIKYDFGGGAGIDGFLRQWELDNKADNSKLWSELAEVISFGGSFDSRHAFWAPYVYSKFPESVDAFVYSAAIDSKVRVFAQPDQKSKVLGLLNYNIVKVLPEQSSGNNQWQHIQVTEGVEGYVETKHLRSQIDYRACFTQKDGIWQLTFFVAGD